MNIAIVIPAYNEAATIARICRDVSSYGTVIVIDDCSADDTAVLAEQAGANVVRHASNAGYDGALQSGFAHAASLAMDAVVTFDADGQHSTETLGKICDYLRSGGIDLVLGIRPQPARFSEHLFSLYTRWRFAVPDILCGLKGYRMALYHENGRFDGTRSIGTELALYALRNGANYKLIPVHIHPREEGKARFGSILRANRQILRAMFKAMLADLKRSPSVNSSLGHSPKH